MTGLRAYEWWDDRLYLHVDSGFIESNLDHARQELPPAAYRCLARRAAQRVHVPHNGTIVISADDDELAETCVETMKGYTLRTALKWSPDAGGGSLFFDEDGP